MPSNTGGDTPLLELAASLIRIPSLTPVRSDLRPAAEESLNCLQEFLESSGVQCTRLSFDGGHDRWGYAVDNLYAEWRNAPNAPELCFIGHTDVVPAGARSAWSFDPYSGVIENGFMLGRGATDMKGAVAAFAVAAVEYAKICRSNGSLCNVSLLITADEEWAAVNGTRRVLEWMSVNGKSPAAFIVGEPSSAEIFGSAIKIGRRGSLCGTFRANGVQGHVAYPDLFESPNRALSLALAIMHDHTWHDAEPGLPATNFETIALESGDFAATAIVPSEASALWNIRFTHHQTPEALTETLQGLLDQLPEWACHHSDANLMYQLRIAANLDSVSLPYYSPPGRLANVAKSVLAARCGAEPELNATGGTTDGRFIHAYFPNAEIIELGLPENGGLSREKHPEKFGRAGGMHQIDECCAIADLQALTICYRDLLSAYLGH